MLPTPEVRNLDDRVYEPAEDLFLLLDALEAEVSELKNLRFPIVCEIGAGSGVVSAMLKTHICPDGVYLATDINPIACKTAYNTIATNAASGTRNVTCLQASLTSPIRPKLIDILVFNPPYVPNEDVPAVPDNEDDNSWLDLALLGGHDGMEVTWQVLDNLDTILAPGGIAYVLFCARNHPDDVSAEMRSRGWTVNVVEHRRAGWEVLSILKFTRAEEMNK